MAFSVFIVLADEVVVSAAVGVVRTPPAVVRRPRRYPAVILGVRGEAGPGRLQSLGPVVDPRRRAGTPAAVAGIIGCLMVAAARAAAAAARNATNKELLSARHEEGSCGRGGPRSWTPQLIRVREQDQIQNNFEALSRGWGSSKVFSFTNPEKSFQTYCLPSPHLLTQEHARQRNQLHGLQIVLRGYPPLRGGGKLACAGGGGGHWSPFPGPPPSLAPVTGP